MIIVFRVQKKPRRFYELLKNEDINWSKVYILLIRQVPIDNDESIVNILNS